MSQLTHTWCTADTAAKVEAKEEVKEEVKEGVVAGVKAEASAEDLDKRAGKLDLQLAYLWRVHGVDYYAGKELADPMSFSARGTAARTLRGPKPEEGEQIAEADGMLTKIAVWLAGPKLGTAHEPLPGCIPETCGRRHCSQARS